mmetsp:Transcript_80823/g.228765  ORF Transcript_80823/g.228765 Transcript_80823/m.228765 type:complete len:561 (+) Transcript_80823:76-1758(+)
MAAMRLVACPLPELRADENGRALVSEAAPSLLWLVGVVSAEEVLIASAAEASPPSAVLLSDLEAALPEGLRAIGVFVRHAGASKPPSWPSAVPLDWRSKLQFLATCDDDGALVAWDMQLGEQQSLRPWTVDKSALSRRACLRGRLTISLAACSHKQATLRLMDLAEALPQSLRFHFAGSDEAVACDQLQTSSLQVPLPGAGRVSSPVGVGVYAEALGANGPTNFIDLDASVPAVYSLDFAAYVTPDCSKSTAAAGLVAAARRQLLHAAATVASQPSLGGVAFRCFAPEALGHVVCLCGTEGRAAREGYHRLLRLPLSPLLLPECAVPWGGDGHPRATGKPVRPHSDCGARPSWWKGGEQSCVAFVQGCYEYSHYMQDNFDDNGWGCAYRSLQTCVSWYRMQFYTPKDVPNITDIQTQLKHIDEAHKDLRVGGKTWIGTIEGMYLLQDYLGVECRMLYCQDAADLATQAPQLLRHLESQGTPVMMGAGQKAFTLVGLCHDGASGECAFLIVDPHYTGADDMKTILQKGWVGWKNLAFFEKEAGGGFINCCLPQVPQGSEHI